MNKDVLYDLVSQVLRNVEDTFPNASPEMQDAITEEIIMYLLYPTQEG